MHPTNIPQQPTPALQPEVPLTTMLPQPVVRPELAAQQLPTANNFFQPMPRAVNPATQQQQQYGPAFMQQPQPQAQYGPQFMQPAQPVYFQSDYTMPEPQPKRSRLKLSLIIAGAVIGVLVSILLVTTFIASRNKDFATTSNSANSLELTNYSSSAGKFSMQIPKGWTVSDKKSESDDSSQEVSINSPVDPKDSTAKQGQVIYVRYNHQADASKGASFNEYIQDIKDEISKDISSASDYEEKIDQTAAGEMTIGGKQAYKVQLTTTDNKTASVSSTTRAYVYINATTEYKIEFTGAYTDTAFNATVDQMLASFNPQ